MTWNAAGALLRATRHRAGLSQRELAERAGTAQSVVARIELGFFSNAGHLGAILFTLGCGCGSRHFAYVVGALA